MFGINNYLVPEAKCCKVGEASSSLGVCVYTTLMQLFLCTVTHMHACAHWLLTCMNATSGEKKEKRKDERCCVSTGRTVLTCRELTGPHDLKKGRMEVSETFFFWQFIHKYKDFQSHGSCKDFQRPRPAQTLSQATTFWPAGARQVITDSAEDLAFLPCVKPQSMYQYQTNDSSKEWVSVLGELTWFAKGSLVSLKKHEMAQNNPHNFKAWTWIFSEGVEQKVLTQWTETVSM